MYVVLGPGYAESVDAGQRFVSCSFTLAGADADNYVVDYIDPIIVTISKCPIKIKIDDKTSKVNEPLVELTYQVISKLGFVERDIANNLINIVLTKAPGDAAGTYLITGECDNPNYEITWLSGIYTLQNVAISDVKIIDDKIVEEIIIETEIGMAPEIRLSVDDVIKEVKQIDLPVRKYKIKKAFDINIVNENNEKIELCEKVTVRILISKDLRKYRSLKVLYISDNGEVTDMKAVRDGDYLIFETDHFSKYAIVNAGLEAFAPYLIWGGELLIVIIIIAAVSLKKSKSYPKAPKQENV